MVVPGQGTPRRMEVEEKATTEKVEWAWWHAINLRNLPFIGLYRSSATGTGCSAESFYMFPWHSAGCSCAGVDGGAMMSSMGRSGGSLFCGYGATALGVAAAMTGPSSKVAVSVYSSSQPMPTSSFLSCDRRLLLGHLLSPARLPGWCEEGWGGTVTGASGRFCRRRTVAHHTYSTLAQPPLSLHSWYNSRKQEVTERRGGNDLPAADSVVVR
jgi:hypothetical protein